MHPTNEAELRATLDQYLEHNNLSLFQAIERFMETMNKTNSTLDKKKALEENPFIQYVLYFVYDSNVNRYGLTSTNLKKQKNKKNTAKPQANKRRKLGDVETPAAPPAVMEFWSMLSALRKRELTGNAAIEAVQLFIDASAGHEETIHRMIDGDLKIGVGAAIINDVFPGLISEFKVVLANDFSKFAQKVDFTAADWYASRKMDGCRCIVKIDHAGEIEFFSREGNPFKSLDNAKGDIRSLQLTNTVLDCEACVLNPDGSENFSSCVSQVAKKKDFTIASPVLYIFDILSMADFLSSKGDDVFSHRQERLKQVFENYQGSCLRHLEQVKINNQEHFQEKFDEATAKKWEGLILRKDVPYEAKRSNDTLKVKNFLEEEFEVTGTQMGTKQMLKNGKKVEVDTLSAVTIVYKGNVVHVGSGFSDEERQKIFDNPQSIVGKQITVQFFEESSNKKGGVSMRFPTKKMIWWEPRNI